MNEYPREQGYLSHISMLKHKHGAVVGVTDTDYGWRRLHEATVRAPVPVSSECHSDNHMIMQGWVG